MDLYEQKCLKKKEWIKSIYPEFSNEKWYDFEVFNPDRDINYYDFFDFVRTQEGVSISPQNVVGLRYGYAYNCFHHIKWIDMLYELKRLDEFMRQCHSRADVIDVISNDPEPKVVEKYGGKYFTTGGQHRITLSKFLELDRVVVTVHEYKLNKPKVMAYLRKQRNINQLISWRLVCESNHLNRTDFLKISIRGKETQIHTDLLFDFINRVKKVKRIKVFGRVLVGLKYFVCLMPAIPSKLSKSNLSHLDYHLVNHFKSGCN